tara:strand:- start:83 stop:289 length:207 start_codon:yes stop_codon:yes gene_type:complete
MKTWKLQVGFLGSEIVTVELYDNKNHLYASWYRMDQHQHGQEGFADLTYDSWHQKSHAITMFLNLKQG